MKGTKTYPKGGVHPPDSKSRSEHKALKNALIPQILTVPLAQHLGKPAEIAVQVGDEVREGTLLGKSSGFISAPVHSPVPGKVKEIRDVYLGNGLKSPAVIIEMEGEFDRSGKEQERHDWRGLSGEELLQLISESGIVGLGGATFPTHVKFSIPKGKKAELFVVNGVECEPYLTIDHRLMLEKTDELLEGVEIIQKIIQPERIAVGIEENKPDAIEVMEKRISERGMNIEVVPLELKYPQGDEKLLIKAITGQEVPSGGLPIDIGAVVSNAGTVYSIYEAVVFRKPLIERFVTVSGGAIKDPSNLKVRIGTSIGDLIEECGGFSEVPEKIVVGGPMTGTAVYDLDTPVIKGTSGVLALTSKEVKSSRRTACLSCGRCIEACPMGLNPTILFKLVDHLKYDESLDNGLMDCRECGSCGFVCPARIPLVQGFKLGKRMARKKKG
ncbi:MAG TPA: electron transport complex subunit RsxC [Sediminispirochaeta sp.]|nr:electron transport complex subunit RsxC [Sediminispirochaeta sp.]